MEPSGKLIDEKTYNNVELIEYELNQPTGIYLIEISDSKGQRSLVRLIKQQKVAEYQLSYEITENVNPVEFEIARLSIDSKKFNS